MVIDFSDFRFTIARSRQERFGSEGIRPANAPWAITATVAPLRWPRSVPIKRWGEDGVTCRMRWKPLNGWGLCFIACLVTHCQGGAQGEDVLVRAWGKPLIMRATFRDRLAQEAPECQEKQDQACAELRRNLLDLMIREALLLKYSERRGMTVSESDLRDAQELFLEDYSGAEELPQRMGVDWQRWRGMLEGQLRIQLLLEEILQDVAVDDEQVAAYYRDHRELFVQPREVRVYRIVAAQNEDAVELLRRLKKGAEFSFLAKQYSLGPEAALGGDLGFLRPGQMPLELEEAAFSLEVGQVSEVIPSAYGFHILRVEERREPRELPLREVKEEIRNLLLHDKAQRRLETWLKEQRGQAKVKILDSALATTH
jgi:peptidyl-prolyl cis-trans isomerase C